MADSEITPTPMGKENAKNLSYLTTLHTSAPNMNDMSTHRSRAERVRCQSSIPAKLYKDISDGSVKSDREGKEGEILPDNTPPGRKNLEPKDLEKELKSDKFDRIDRPVVTHHSKKVKSVNIKSKVHKKDFYNPTEDYFVKVNFEPSKLVKKTNPNDANAIDGNTAIRKFKDLENKFVDLDENLASKKITKFKTDVRYSNHKAYGLASKDVGDKVYLSTEENEEHSNLHNVSYFNKDTEVGDGTFIMSSGRKRPDQTDRTQVKVAKKPVKKKKEKKNYVSDGSASEGGDNYFKTTSKRVNRIRNENIENNENNQPRKQDNLLHFAEHDQFSCKDCEPIYKMAIFNNTPLKSYECLSCGYLINATSLQFYIEKYRLLSKQGDGQLSSEGELSSGGNRRNLDSGEFPNKEVIDNIFYYLQKTEELKEPIDINQRRIHNINLERSKQQKEPILVENRGIGSISTGFSPDQLKQYYNLFKNDELGVKFLRNKDSKFFETQGYSPKQIDQLFDKYDTDKSRDLDLKNHPTNRSMNLKERDGKESQEKLKKSFKDLNAPILHPKDHDQGFEDYQNNKMSQSNREVIPRSNLKSRQEKDHLSNLFNETKNQEEDDNNKLKPLTKSLKSHQEKDSLKDLFNKGHQNETNRADENIYNVEDNKPLDKNTLKNLGFKPNELDDIYKFIKSHPTSYIHKLDRLALIDTGFNQDQIEKLNSFLLNSNLKNQDKGKKDKDKLVQKKGVEAEKEELYNFCKNVTGSKDVPDGLPLKNIYLTKNDLGYIHGLLNKDENGSLKLSNKDKGALKTQNFGKEQLKEFNKCLNLFNDYKLGVIPEEAIEEDILYPTNVKTKSNVLNLQGDDDNNLINKNLNKNINKNLNNNPDNKLDNDNQNLNKNANLVSEDPQSFDILPNDLKLNQLLNEGFKPDEVKKLNKLADLNKNNILDEKVLETGGFKPKQIEKLNNHINKVKNEELLEELGIEPAVIKHLCYAVERNRPQSKKHLANLGYKPEHINDLISALDRYAADHKDEMKELENKQNEKDNIVVEDEEEVNKKNPKGKGKGKGKGKKHVSEVQPKEDTGSSHYSDEELERLNQNNKYRLAQLKNFKNNKMLNSGTDGNTDGNNTDEDPIKKPKNLNYNTDSLDELSDDGLDKRLKAYINSAGKGDPESEDEFVDMLMQHKLRDLKNWEKLNPKTKNRDKNTKEIFPDDAVKDLKEYEKLKNWLKNKHRNGGKYNSNSSPETYSDPELDEDTKKRDREAAEKRRKLQDLINKEKKKFAELTNTPLEKEKENLFNEPWYNSNFKSGRGAGPNMLSYGAGFRKPNKKDGFTQFGVDYNGSKTLPEDFQLNQARCTAAYLDRKMKKEAEQAKERQRLAEVENKRRERELENELKKEQQRLDLERAKELARMKEEELAHQREMEKEMEALNRELLKEKERLRLEKNRQELERQQAEWQKEQDRLREEKEERERKRRDEMDKLELLAQLEKEKMEELMREKERQKELEREKRDRAMEEQARRLREEQDRREAEKLKLEKLLQDEKEKAELERLKRQALRDEEKEKARLARQEQERKLKLEADRRAAELDELERKRREDKAAREDELKEIERQRALDREKAKKDRDEADRKRLEEEKAWREGMEKKRKEEEEERQRQKELKLKEDEESRRIRKEKEDKKRKEDEEERLRLKEIERQKQEELDRIAKLKKLEEEMNKADENRKKQLLEEEQERKRLLGKKQREEEERKLLEETKKKAQEEEERLKKLAEDKKAEEEALKRKKSVAKPNRPEMEVEEEPQRAEKASFQKKFVQIKEPVEEVEKEEDLSKKIKNFKFEVLNREADEDAAAEEEEFLNKKKDVLERFEFSVEIRNLFKNHIGNEFLLEVLYSNSENPRDFVTIGTAEKVKVTGDTIVFPEIFSTNFLFERMQFVRLIFNCTNDSASELTINLAKVVTNKLQPLMSPLDMMKNDYQYYNGNKSDKKKQSVIIKFNRVTPGLKVMLPSFFVDFKYPSASTIGSRIRYYFYVENIDGEIKQRYTSNECMGKGPYNYAIQSHNNKKEFFHNNVKRYIWEFWDGTDNYVGQGIIEKKDMIALMEKKQPFPLEVRNDEPAIFKVKKPMMSSKNLLKNNAISPVKKNTDNSKLSTANLKGKKNPKEFITGKMNVRFDELRKKRFFDLIFEGMNVAFDIAVDYTGSNKDPTDPESLHTFNLDENLYCRAITSCGNILKEYDSDQLFPIFGFGGVPSGGTGVSHCFNLNGKKDPNVEGIEGLIQTYIDSLKGVQLVGPTYFQYILKSVIDIAKNVKKKKDEPLTYHIFMILTDGKIDDFDKTKELCVEAAKLGISLIIVGIGEADFGKMDILDGNDIPVQDPNTGETIFRDNVQFIAFRELENDGARLAAKVLESIPAQCEEFGRKKGL